MLLELAACGRVGFGTSNADVGDANDGGGDVPPGCTVVLGAGRQHTAALFSDGAVRVWGYGAYGQIGDGQMVDRPAPTTIALPSRVVSAGGGRFETCAVLDTGTVYCWGEGTSGQLGDGNSTTSPSPVVVANLTDAVEVAPAAIHACARRATGEVSCWGDGTNGRLGTGDTTSSPVPVQTMGITTAKRLVAGGSTACAILADDTLRCWGYNQDGEVGNNTMTDALAPVEPLAIGTVRSVSTRDRTTCAARSDSAVLCWGANDLGQAGTGVIGANLLVPTSVKTTSGDLIGADEVGQGIAHGCARLGANVWCWGRNTNGQLGDGNVGAGRPYAAPVVGLPSITRIAIGAYTSCAVDTDQAVWCWGLGGNGELGNGQLLGNQPTPTLSFAACP